MFLGIKPKYRIDGNVRTINLIYDFEPLGLQVLISYELISIFLKKQKKY